MKTIDFTQPGGFPLTQDQMGYLQAAWQEVANQLLGLGVNNSEPAILSGMVSSTSGSTVTVSAGWFVYNGTAVRFPSQTYTTPVTSGFAMYVVITPTAAPLTFNDGSTPSVVLDSTGVLTMLPSTTPVDSTHFLLASIVPFGVGLALNNRDAAWNSLTVNTPALSGGVTGTVYFKKDWAANTLRIKAALLCNNAQNFPAFPTVLYADMGISLPPGYFPVGLTSKYFTAYNLFSTSFKDFTDTQYLQQYTCGINTIGSLGIILPKPDVTIAGYGIVFDAIVSLD